MKLPNETYLGDGLYARNDGWMIWLRAPRTGMDHEVALEPQIFEELLRFAAKHWNAEAMIEILKEEVETKATKETK